MNSIKIFFTLLLFFNLPSLVTAQSPSMQEVSSILTYYYKEPSDKKVESILEYLEGGNVKHNPGIHPPLTGFLAAVFTKNPNKIDKWLSLYDYSPTAKGILTYSLWLSKNKKKAISFLDRHGINKSSQSYLSEKSRGLKKLKLSSASNLDQFWAAYSATGDMYYVEKIFDVVKDALKKTTIEAQDLFLLSHNFKKSSKELKELLSKYEGKKEFPEFILAGTALWSMGGNIKNHTAVAQFMNKKIKSSKDKKLLKALRPLHFVVTNNKVVDTGDNHKIMLFSTPNPKYAQQPFQDLLKFKGVNNVFSSNDTINIIGLVGLAINQSADLNLTITHPNGVQKSYGPFKLASSKDKASIELISVGLEKEDLSGAGIYKYKIYGKHSGADVMLSSGLILLE